MNNNVLIINDKKKLFYFKRFILQDASFVEVLILYLTMNNLIENCNLILKKILIVIPITKM